MVQRRPNKLNWSLIFSIASFAIGYAINAGSNYVSYTAKVDHQAESLQQISAQIKEINDKLEVKGEKATQTHNNLNTRVTALEIKVFGQPSVIQTNLFAINSLAK